MAVDTSVGAMDDGGQQLRDLQTKVLELEQALQSMSLGQNLAQREFDAIQGQLGDIAGEVDAQAVQFDPSTGMDGQTHDGAFVGDPVNNNAQETYIAPVGNPEIEVNSDDPEGDTVIIELGDETIYTSASTWPKPYDLYDVSYAATPSITFKVRGAKWNDGTDIGIPFFGASNYWVGLAGQWTAVANGSVSFDTETTFTANDLIYLKIVRGTSAAQTLEKNSSSSFANATDSASQAVIHIPLWGFEVDGNEMRVIDLRDVPRIDMMGN